MIITIDGPAGSGKSTVAKKLAEKLGFTYVETGALYRSLTYGCLMQAIAPQEGDALHSFLKKATVRIALHNQQKRFFLDEHDVTDHLRDPSVTSAVSAFSALSSVRQALLGLQREAAREGNTIFDGRDMGTVVFPNANLKVFLDASPEVRARRRRRDLGDSAPPLEEVLADIVRRDTLDASRDIAPLVPAHDAHIIDTSSMSIDQVVATIETLAKENK